MGLFSKFFRKKTADEEIREITLEEAREICNEKIGKLSYEEVREICENIRETINQALQALENLKKLEIDKKMNRRLYYATKQSRKQLIITLKKELHNIKLQDIYDYYSIQELQQTLSKSLQNIAKGNVKHSYYVSLSFRKEMQNIGRIINQLNDQGMQLTNYLKPIIQKNQSYQTLLDEIKNKKNLEKEIQKLKQYVENLKNRKKTLQQELTKLEEKTSITYEKEKRELEKLNKEKRELESKIFSIISFFSRPFRKYGKIGVFEKPIAIMINNYLEHPVKTALKDKEKILTKILNGVEKLVQKKELGLKENINKKTLLTIKRIRNGELKKLILNYEKLEKKIKNKQEELKPLVKEAEKQQTRFKRKTDKLKELTSEIKDLEQKTQLKKEELYQTKEILKQKVRDLSNNLILKY